jgi:serine/threonine protein kinase
MRTPGFLSRRAGLSALDRSLPVFESILRSGEQTLDQIWKRAGQGQSTSLLASLVKADLARRFSEGEQPRILEYLERYPDLANDRDRVVSLVYEEFCLLQENGANPDSQSFCLDYAPWGDSLASQLAYHRDLSRAIDLESPAVTFPEPGEVFEKYRIISLLGVGGVARVYLATDEELGGRRLAIKVSASFGQEPSILAKLDHRNIVPILTVAESESGLRGICMPYRPGPTLEGLIREIGRGRPPRSARAVLEALSAPDHRGDRDAEEPGAGWADFPSDRTFPEAVAWIGHALAQALGYLHKQGVFHRDIKPANILLAYREGPQLLDFNLAKVPNNPEGACAAQRGGTLPYMAPEQLAAFLDPEAWSLVGEQADLYSLGLVLRELLTGRPPELTKPDGSLAREIRAILDRRHLPFEPIREINPSVPPALESIVEKCLAVEPKDRYRGAVELAEDLRQFLDRKPLRFAPNTSRFERIVNVIHRNRQAILVALVSALLLIPLSRVGRPVDSGLDDIKRAESLLVSRRPDVLLKAKATFEDLHLRQPNTARTSLGLALTLSRLDDPRKKLISDLFKESTTKTDSEAEIRRWLVREPNSAALLLSLGIVLSNERRYPEARTFLEQSLQLDPRGIAARVNLGNVEQLTGHDSLAIDQFAKAVEIASSMTERPQFLEALRKVLMHSLVRLINRELAPSAKLIDRQRVRSLVDQLAMHVRSFQEDRPNPGSREGEAEHAFWTDYFAGCLASIEGALGRDPERPAGLADPFGEAEAGFRRARRHLTKLESTPERLQQVTYQEGLLSRRRGMAPAAPGNPAPLPAPGLDAKAPIR